MSDVGTVYVKVMPSAKGFGKSLESQIGSGTAAAADSIGGAVESAAGKAASSLSKTLGGALGALGKTGFAAMTAITGGVGTLVSALMDSPAWLTVTCAVCGYVAPLIANGFGVAYNPVRQSR